MATDNQLAKMAFWAVGRKRLLQMAGVETPNNLPADLVGAGEVFANQAWSVIHTMGSGRDPKIHARALAEEAVIRYIVLRLDGMDPLTDPQLAVLIRSWAKVAAKAD